MKTFPIRSYSAGSDSFTSLDVADAPDLEIRIIGKDVWLNTSLGCICRILRVKGPITVVDERAPTNDQTPPDDS